MNKAQQIFADANPALGALLTQIEASYASLPEGIRSAFDKLGEAQVPHGCHCDIDDDGVPDECVMDTGKYKDCVAADRLHREGKKKTDCVQWKPIKMVIGGAN
jgi:hypothetical protein